MIRATIERQVAPFQQLILLIVASRSVDARVHADKLFCGEELYTIGILLLFTLLQAQMMNDGQSIRR